MSKKRRRIIALILSFFFLGTPTYEGKESPKEKTSGAYAEYSNGSIYIGNSNYLRMVSASDGDVLVLDSRSASDPNMKIFSSYRIDDSKTRKEILEKLLEYEKENPSDWNRSLDSMQIEWYFHNLMHFLNYELDRTTDVDLNNNDEEIYKDVFKKVLRLNKNISK